ncbi:MAG: SUMF1/EgtB/PvdO family nonheme iron enzyme [Treponema sp.]|uniref:SUMF1/EgtB/PvdO family nonheme iron enzyme n=1 Tax=Treponema sp. TaxID=166 RepID=UPI0025F42EA2|nr:SUMF1/EgtB/PvdO family nonheme iron enzyme [Treponema sp.]MBR0496608.1 SUMF1/EgtB/PvdO family nonheme iron enzyme [Treponema sp.]
MAEKLGIKPNIEKEISFENYIASDFSPYVSTSEIYVTGGIFFIGAKEYSVNDFIIAKTECADDAGFPIVNKSWIEIIAYCNELSKRNNLDCVYEISKNGKKVKAHFSKNGYRLPTKEEWYWVATGAEKRTVFGSKSNFNSSVWYLKNSDEKNTE